MIEATVIRKESLKNVRSARLSHILPRMRYRAVLGAYGDLGPPHLNVHEREVISIGW